MSTASRWAGIVIVPWMRGNSRNSVCSFTARASGSMTDDGCATAGAICVCAFAGTAMATTPKNTSAATALRGAHDMYMHCPFIRLVGLDRDAFAIRGLPAPGAGAVAAREHALFIDLRDDLAVAGQQRLGRAHLGAQRQLAFEQPVGAVFAVFLDAAGHFRAVAAGTESAFVHLAARAEVADLRILRRAERAGVETIAAADAQVLRVQHHALGGRYDAGDRADRRARRVGAMHARHRDRTFARLAVIDGDDAPAVDPPWHLVLVLAR